jgi:hypothetical protein
MSRTIALAAALLVGWGWGSSLPAQETPAKENAPGAGAGGGLGGLRRGAASGGAPAGGLGGLRDAATSEDTKVETATDDRAPARTLFQAAQARGLVPVTKKTDFEGILQQPTKFNFVDTPLSDAIAYLADQHDIDIQLDAKGLTDAAVDPSAPLTRSVRKPISLESGLRLILDEFDLTFVIQDEVMKITSTERADVVLTTKVYPVGDLLGGRRNWGPLINLITSTIVPDSWNDNGGPGSIQPFTVGVSLVISQKRDAHSEVRDLLAQMRAELPKPGDADNAAHKTTTAVYQLGGAAGEQTAEAIKKLVVPTSWQGQGGEGQVCVITRGTSGLGTSDLLLIRQTNDIHDQIQDLLFEFTAHGRPGGKGGMLFGMPAGGVAAPPAAPAPPADAAPVAPQSK